MPKSGSSGKGYDVTSSGNNSQGNHYCSRDYTPSSGGSQANSNTYHYSNNDGESKVSLVGWNGKDG
jgi:hypothetical protein